MSTEEAPEREHPLLRIVKGDPTPEEVAALVAVVSAMAAGAAEAASKQARPKPEWSAHHRKLRGTHRHGPGAWRASAPLTADGHRSPTGPRLRLAGPAEDPAERRALPRGGGQRRRRVSSVAVTAPADYTLKLAQLKAVAVAATEKRAIVIGCDSVLALDGEILGKPASDDEAIERWQQMRGRAGVLHTGHCVIDTHREVWLARSAATQVRFAHVSDEEIEAYVATGEPSAVAGAFTLDGLGGAFVSGVTGDPHNVVGISLPLLRLMLEELGFVWTEFWELTVLGGQLTRAPHAARRARRRPGA